MITVHNKVMAKRLVDDADERPHTCTVNGSVRVAVVGEPAVGKTALVHMLGKDGAARFPEHYSMTCGVELHLRQVLLPGSRNTSVNLHLFDCGGQDVFNEDMPKYWRGGGIAAVLLVYDATRTHTLDACHSWHQRVCDAAGRANLPGAVVANKIDRRDSQVVTRADGQRLAEAIGMPYFEASAKEADGIDGPFRHIAAAAMRTDVPDVEIVTKVAELRAQGLSISVS
mmetsp:Transcript_17287/g.28939  ORF Transcript_17287/g.28939 Transcript_17287/m.28939 type:complete len:227 (-) Transcript_17287:137-817(-)